MELLLLILIKLKEIPYVNKSNGIIMINISRLGEMEKQDIRLLMQL